MVLTLNGLKTDESYIYLSQVKGDLQDLMFVRFRVNTWNLELCGRAINTWTKDGVYGDLDSLTWNDGVPLVLTDMRYYDGDKIPEDHKQYYEFRKHILNSYWMLNEEGRKKVFSLLRFPNVFWCGNPFSLSTTCQECRLCEILYIKAKVRMEASP